MRNLPLFAFLLSAIAPAALFGGEQPKTEDLEQYWKKAGWTCRVESKEVIVTNSAGRATPNFLTCVYTAECKARRESATVTQACKTTLENACPSVDDCIAMRVAADAAKDSSMRVLEGVWSDTDGTVRSSTEQKATVEARYGTGCKYTPDDWTAVIARKLSPRDTQYDKVCINRVSCDTQRARNVVSQLACPTAGVEKDKDGVKYPVCPGIQDCLATALDVRKPTRELVARELPGRGTPSTTQSNTNKSVVDVATHMGGVSNALLSK